MPFGTRFIAKPLALIMKRQLIIFTFILANLGLKAQDKHFETLFQTIEDSIFTKYSSVIFIDSISNGKIHSADYFGTKDRCGIPFELITEFFNNGNRSLTPMNISEFIEVENRNKNSRFKLGIWDMVSYKKIWFCRLTVWDKRIKDRHDSYSLIFIDDELFCMTKSEWIVD